MPPSLVVGVFATGHTRNRPLFSQPIGAIEQLGDRKRWYSEDDATRSDVGSCREPSCGKPIILPTTFGDALTSGMGVLPTSEFLVWKSRSSDIDESRLDIFTIKKLSVP
jgi:hypothetical protein